MEEKVKEIYPRAICGKVKIGGKLRYRIYSDDSSCDPEILSVEDSVEEAWAAAFEIKGKKA